MNKFIIESEELRTAPTVGESLKIQKLFDKYAVIINVAEPEFKQYNMPNYTLKLIIRYTDDDNYTVRVFRRDESEVTFNFIDEVPSDKISWKMGIDSFKKDVVIAIIHFLEFHEYLTLNSSTRVVEEKIINTSNKSKSSSTKKSSNNSKVYLFKDIIKYINKKNEKMHHNITCEAWEVRGHYRRYKSGKVVFIKPFKKGKNKDSEVSSSRVYYLKK